MDTLIVVVATCLAIYFLAAGFVSVFRDVDPWSNWTWGVTATVIVALVVDVPPWVAALDVVLLIAVAATWAYRDSKEVAR